MRVARIVCWMTLIVNPELLLDWVITLGRLAKKLPRTLTLRTAGDQQQCADLLELAQLLGALEPLAGIFVGSRRVVGYALTLGAREACLGQKLDVLRLRQRMHRDLQFDRPAQRIMVVLIKVDEDEQLPAGCENALRFL